MIMCNFLLKKIFWLINTLTKSQNTWYLILEEKIYYLTNCLFTHETINEQVEVSKEFTRVVFYNGN